MKKYNEFFIKRRLVFGLFILVMVTFGCSRRPPEGVIVDKVKKLLDFGFHDGCVASRDEKTMKLEIIEILEYGNFNKEQIYWPIKMRVKGSTFCIIRAFGRVKRENVEWDKLLYFRFHKQEDDFGNVEWVIKKAHFEDY